MDPAIEIARFVTPTQFHARLGIVLGLRLRTSAPENMSPAEAEALADVMTSVDAINDLTKGRLQRPQPRVRPLARALARHWVGARMRLEGCERCGTVEDAKRAAELRKALLPVGTRFVTNHFDRAYTISLQLVERIEELGLEAEVAHFVGPAFLGRMRALLEDARHAHGMGDERLRTPPGQALPRANRLLALRIARCARVVSASVTLEEKDGSLERFLHAMEPLAAHRRRRRRGASHEEAEADADEGTPEGPRPAPGRSSTATPSTATAPTTVPTSVSSPASDRPPARPPPDARGSEGRPAAEARPSADGSAGPPS